ncbi:MAG TPA: GNAT family N-acetyltransferase [Nocardioides sp.]|nr:GNAT family N-acetyltransferase [Nocardioides sp.]
MVTRVANEQDLPAIKAIYDHQVLTGIATFDTEPPALEKWAERLASDQPGDHMLVAESDGAVAGYAYSTTYRPRLAYARTRETSVYLAPEAGGRGLGRALYDDLLARLRADGMHVALGVIALPNAASEALHRACGFERVGVLPEVGHKLDRWIDTAFWALKL